jgi:hypothetical protein
MVLPAGGSTDRKDSIDVRVRETFTQSALADHAACSEYHDFQVPPLRQLWLPTLSRGIRRKVKAAAGGRQAINPHQIGRKSRF